MKMPFLIRYHFISLPKQHSQRAIILYLKSASVSTNVKVLRHHYLQTLESIWFIIGLMHTGPIFPQYHPHPPSSGKNLENFLVNGFALKVFKTSLFADPLTKWVHV